MTAEWATKLTIALLAEAGFEDNQFQTLQEYSMVVDLIAGNFEKAREDGRKQGLLDAEKYMIYGFHEDDAPSYSQGPAESELQDLATADEVNCIVEKLTSAREALKPFAEEAHRYDPPEGDNDLKAWSSEFTIGDLRRAARELKGETK